MAALMMVPFVADSARNWWSAPGENETANAAKAPEAAAVNVGLAKVAMTAVDAAKAAVDGQAAADAVVNDKVLAARNARSAADLARKDADALKGQPVEAVTKAETDAAAAKTIADRADNEVLKAQTLALQAASKATMASAAAKDAIQRARSESRFGWVGWALVSLLLCSLFPLSAWAYCRLEVPSLVVQVKQDCRLLESQPPAVTSPTASPTTPPPPTPPITSREDSESFSNPWNWLSYLIHCILAVLATLLGVTLFFREPDALLDMNTQRAMQFGFLGAYVYCLNLVYRRYTTLDLQPHVFLSCGVGLIAGMAFNFVAFTAITNVAASTAAGDTEFKGIGAGAAAIMAFSLGYFPNLAIRWFGRVSRTSVHERQRRSDALPLSLIDGISELHESRLQDEGIDNVQNLASANIKDLIINTPFSALEIVEWTDQAVLYLYLDPGEIDSFRRAGVRTVSDFSDIWEGFYLRYTVQPDGSFKKVPSVASVNGTNEFESTRRTLAQQLATTEQRLDNLFRATEQSPNMDYVRTYLQNVQSLATQTRNRLVTQICGRVGRALRESARAGDPPTSTNILKQVAEELFHCSLASQSPAADHATAASLYGQAYLKRELKLYAAARALYEECIQKFPKDPAAFNDLAWLNLTTLCLKTDFQRARDHAREAVKLTEDAKAIVDQAVTQAGAREAAAVTLRTQIDAEPAGAEKERKKAEAENELERARAEKELKQSESDKLKCDLAGYRDTLAFAEIRLGRPAEGFEQSKKAIADWEPLPLARDPRFLETVVSAAETHLPPGIAPTDADKQNATTVLKYAKAQGYANEKTRQRIEKLRTDHNLDLG